MLTSEAVSAIMEMTREVSLIKIEDALFTGILAERSDVRRINAFPYIRTLGEVFCLASLDLIYKQ